MAETNPPADVEQRVARQLAARDWLDDSTSDEEWNRKSADFRADYLTYAREVIALVQPAAAVPASAPTDPVALRERLDAAIDGVFDRWRNGLGDQSPQDAIRAAVWAVLSAAAVPSMYAHVGFRREGVLNETAEEQPVDRGWGDLRGLCPP
ncbi:hypothetical protein [Streptomyces sp. Midd1]|uniref:hypothetical protein n=1 Tax=Streptomyces sp. Midd3 TaxID=3161191 RepID=UPI0034DAE7FE